MKRVIRQQSFKPYTLVGLFATLISTVLLTGFAFAKEASVSASSSGKQVPKETPREGVVEPTQSPKQSQDTTRVTRPAPSKQPKDSIDISSEVKSIEGITWQGDYLWVLDEERKIIDRFDTTLEKLCPDPKYSIDLAQPSALGFEKFKGLAYDKEAEALWATAEGIDIDTKKMVPMLIKINPTNGQTEAINMGIPAKKGFESIEGIAWDEKRESLWVAIYAGFSSSLNQINPKTRQITKSIFSDSYPKGIATDGEHLWSICYNGEEFPSTIDQRIIQPEEHTMLRSREFIKDIPEAEPISLVFDGNDLWYADRKTKRVIKFTQPKKQTPQSK
ncbi:MAG: hypothetical protein F9K48_01780 [Candidatus Brocadia sp.]|nr:MAG: hypothetical protein F9K48_01780 [Candidatus Brocadia sp.]